MATRTQVRVRLNNAQIARLNAPGGMVRFYVQRIGNEVVAEASRRAPRANYYPPPLPRASNPIPRVPGRLKSSIRRTEGGFDMNGSTIYVIADQTIAPHARFVIFGTTGPITSPRGRLLTVPAGSSRGLAMGTYSSRSRFGQRRVYGRDGRPSTSRSMYRYTRSVKGQQANPFMQEALHAVMLRRGLI